MKKFNQFGIKPTEQGFTGDKIKISRIINKPITVKNYKIVPSKFTEKGNGKCLYLHIQNGTVENVVFTGSAVLMEQIERVNKGDFPFETTIINNNDRYEFT